MIISNNFSKLILYNAFNYRYLFKTRFFLINGIYTKTNNKHTQTTNNKIMTLPNMLSLARLGATPIICWAIVNENFKVATILFSVAALSDLFDGYIARNVPNQSSVLGTILDPLADKLLINSVTVTLSYMDLLPTYIAILIIIRDIGIVSYILYLKYSSKINLQPNEKTITQAIKFTPTYLSKINTALQLFLVSSALGLSIINYDLDNVYFNYLNILTATTTVASGIQYYLLRHKFIQKRHP